MVTAPDSLMQLAGGGPMDAPRAPRNLPPHGCNKSLCSNPNAARAAISE